MKEVEDIEHLCVIEGMARDSLNECVALQLWCTDLFFFHGYCGTLMAQTVTHHRDGLV